VTGQDYVDNCWSPREQAQKSLHGWSLQDVAAAYDAGVTAGRAQGVAQAVNAVCEALRAFLPALPEPSTEPAARDRSRRRTPPSATG
jgi:hypothetical protein